MSLLSTTRTKLLTITMAISNYRFNHICWVKSWFYNALWFGLRDSFKMPIYIYNDVQIMATGHVVIEGNHKSGMIRIGSWKAKSHNPTRLLNYGTIRFNGETDIQGGCIIENYGGIIHFGDNLKLAESCKIMCQREITLRDNVHVGYETTFMDTDFHFLINTETGLVKRNVGEILIESGSWISSNCKIMKGTKIPRNSVVATNTLLNKDYSYESPNTIFAGHPGQPVSNHYRRIYNVGLEQELRDFFDSNKTKIFPTKDLDNICLIDNQLFI